MRLYAPFEYLFYRLSPLFNGSYGKLAGFIASLQFTNYISIEMIFKGKSNLSPLYWWMVVPIFLFGLNLIVFREKRAIRIIKRYEQSNIDTSKIYGWVAFGYIFITFFALFILGMLPGEDYYNAQH